jgi:hypothetical protein
LGCLLSVRSQDSPQSPPKQPPPPLPQPLIGRVLVQAGVPEEVDGGLWQGHRMRLDGETEGFFEGLRQAFRQSRHQIGALQNLSHGHKVRHGDLGVAIDSGSGRYSVLFLIASVLYALLGLWFPSALVWVFGLVSLGAWMGAESGYVSGWGAYYLGMNYPLRFVLFGAALALVGLVGEQALHPANTSSFKARLLSMSPQTKVVGLLYLFIALWIMSIFGNYADMVKWEKVRQYELLHWSLLFAAVSIAAVWYGLKRDDGALRGFGLTFLFINLYTRFFEYFWDSIHKAAFFAVLAASFWYIGRRAETIWHFGEHKLPDHPPNNSPHRSLNH